MVETNDFVPMSMEYNLGHLFYPLLKNDYQEEMIRGMINQQLEKEHPNFKSIFFDLEQQSKLILLPKIKDIFRKLLELLEHTSNQVASLENLWDVKNRYSFILVEYYKYSLPEIFDYRSLFFQYGLAYERSELQLKQLFTYLEMKLLVPDHFIVTMNLLQENDAYSNDQIVWNLPFGDHEFESKFLAKFLEVNSIPIPEEFKSPDVKNATFNLIPTESKKFKYFYLFRKESQPSINDIRQNSKYVIHLSNNLIISYSYDKSLLIYGDDIQKESIITNLNTLKESKLFLNTQLYFINSNNNSQKFELSFNQQLNDKIMENNFEIMKKWIESLSSKTNFNNLRLLFNQLDIEKIKIGDWLPKNISLSYENIYKRKYKSGILNKQISCNIVLEVKKKNFDTSISVKKLDNQALFNSINDSEDAIIRESEVKISDEKDYLVLQDSSDFLEQILENIRRYDTNFTRENIIQFCLQDKSYQEGFYIISEKGIFYYFIIKENVENIKKVITDSYQNREWTTTIGIFLKPFAKAIEYFNGYVSKRIHPSLYNIFTQKNISTLIITFLNNANINILLDNLGTNIFFKKERAYLMLKIYLKYLLIKENKQTKTISLKYFQNNYSKSNIENLLNFIYYYIDSKKNKKTSFNLTKAFEQVDDIPLKSLPLLGSNLSPFLEQILQNIPRSILLTLLNTEVKECVEILNFINDQLIDDQSLIYSLFNNINWMKLIKPLEIEMIITVDRSFLEGILKEYYEPEKSKSQKHWCFISVDNEKEFIKKINEKKLIIKDDYLINCNYHQNNQKLFLIDLKKIINNETNTVLPEFEKYIKYIYNPINPNIEKDKSEIDSQDLTYKYVTNKQINEELIKEVKSQKIISTQSEINNLIKSIEDINKKRIEIYQKIKDLANSDNELMEIEFEKYIIILQGQLSQLIHQSLDNYNLVINQIKDQKKIVEFKKILEPFIDYHTNRLTHIVGYKLPQSKQIISQDSILENFIQPDFVQKNSFDSPRILCCGFNDPVKLLIFRTLKDIFNVLLQFLDLKKFNEKYQEVVNSDNQQAVLDILYQINISNYGQVDNSKAITPKVYICNLKFQFEHQKNYLLGQMMDLFFKDIDKDDSVATAPETAPATSPAESDPNLFLNLIKYDIIDFNQTYKLLAGNLDKKKIKSRKKFEILRGLKKKKTRKKSLIL